MLTLPPTPLRPGDRPAIAISGGADSTALLLLTHAANTLPRNALGVGLAAIHINHTLRAEASDEDEAFVQPNSANVSKSLSTSTASTPKLYAQTHRQTIEEAARNLRLRSLPAPSSIKSQATHILTAHTLDDQAETVLGKLLRGAWLEGLSAIAPELPLGPGKLLRPLLQTRREDSPRLPRQNAKTSPGAKTPPTSTPPSPATASATPCSRCFARTKPPDRHRPSPTSPSWPAKKKQRWAIRTRSASCPGLLLPGKPVRGGGPLELRQSNRSHRARPPPPPRPRAPPPRPPRRRPHSSAAASRSPKPPASSPSPASPRPARPPTPPSPPNPAPASSSSAVPPRRAQPTRAPPLPLRARRRSRLLNHTPHLHQTKVHFRRPESSSVGVESSHLTLLRAPSPSFPGSV